MEPRPIGPICPIGPTASCYGTSQTCQGAGESGSLEAWMLGSLAFSLYNYFACRPLVGRSVLRGRGRFGPLGLHALFSVLQGAKAPFPCRGVGQRPTSNRQSVNLPSSQSPLCSLCPFERFVIKTHRQSSCTFVVLRVLRVHLRTLHFSPAAYPSPRRGVPFSGARQRPFLSVTPAFLGKHTEAQGMGTVMRRDAPNGEVPRPLRNLVSSW